MKKICEKTYLFVGILLACLFLSAAPVLAKKANNDAFGMAVGKMAKEYEKQGSGAQSASDPYFSARLIVKGKNAKLTFDKYEAVAVIRSSTNVYLVQFESSAAAKEAHRKLLENKKVVYVEPDGYIGSRDTMDGEIMPSYASGSGARSWGAERINADNYAAYLKKKTKKSITVAVVDSGVSKHTLIGDRLLKGYDFVDGDADASDVFGHGTHVAGIIADSTRGLNVNILPVRVLNESGGGDQSVVGVGILYAADHGAKVINLSLGGRHSDYLDECIAYAIKKGAVVCVSAGNQYGKDTSGVCPAHIDRAIVVGAVNSHDQLAEFSNIGTSVDVVAPGVDIVSSVPGGKYMSLDGTSQAAPYVAAAAAMYRLAYPSKSVSQIEALIRKNVRDVGTPGKDKLYGAGVIYLKVPKEKSKTVKAVTLSLSKTKASLEEGEEITLTAKITPSNTTDKTVTWKSSKADIVGVSGGILTAKKAGTATITASTSNGITASCSVTVKKAASGAAYTNLPEYDELEADSAKMKKAVKLKTGANLFSAKTGDLDGMLKFTAPSSGVYEFTFSAPDQKARSKKAEVEIAGRVYVETKSGKFLRWLDDTKVETQNGNTSIIYFCAPQSKKLFKKINADKENKAEQYIPGRYARVALKKGAALYFDVWMYHMVDGEYVSPVKMKVNIKKVSNASSVAVKSVEPTGIKLNPAEVVLEKGEEVLLFGEIVPSHATEKKITWKSSHLSVAAVSGDFADSRTITAKSAGTAVITATTRNGKQATCKVTVTEPSDTSFAVMPKYTYDEWANALAIKTGENKVMSPEPYYPGSLKFQAPEDGTYEFTFSVMDPSKTGISDIYIRGHITFYQQEGESILIMDDEKVETQYGFKNMICVCSPNSQDYHKSIYGELAASSDKAGYYLPDRYARVDLKAGDIVYLEVSVDGEYKDSAENYFYCPGKLTVNIEKK